MDGVVNRCSVTGLTVRSDQRQRIPARYRNKFSNAPILYHVHSLSLSLLPPIKHHFHICQLLAQLKDRTQKWETNLIIAQTSLIIGKLGLKNTSTW